MNRKVVETTRLALFGRMAMGVAHEIDNHLSVVMGFSELLQLPGSDEKKAAGNAAKIFAAGEKIGVIVKHFSYYVRPHEPAPEPFLPADLVKEILPFSRYDLSRGGVTPAIPESIPTGLITADRRDLALALLALLFNGSEAMEGKGGTLRLAVSRGGGVWDFSVADEGPGIPAEVMPRIFEEGFTTKAAPFHAGMGLPVARHLAGEMGGAVTLANLPAGGCLATLRVPEKRP
ncbi:MAG: HAMP domain-containing histidine kinase [Deltaproteobacteria bacterium]|nr:HAMP domain-containing histidine kinase [Deltaproteobacteria bacterium]